MVETSESTAEINGDFPNFERNLLQVVEIGDKAPFVVPDPTRAFQTVNWGHPMVRKINGHTDLYVPTYCFKYAVSHMVPCLIRYDLDTDEQSLHLMGNEFSRNFFLDPSAKLVADETYNQKNFRWRIRINRDGDMVDAASGEEGIDVPQILGFGPNGDTVLTEFLENKASVWKLLSIKDGTFSSPMNERRSLTHPIEVSGRMIGGVEVGDWNRYVFFDPSKQRIWDSIVNAYAGERVDYVSAARNFRKFVVLVLGPKMGYQYQLVDLDEHKTQAIGAVYDGIANPLEVRAIDYPAADGLQIHAYLTLPANRAATNLPLVVLPHGGPAIRDFKDFDWWAQAIADQGYAVLQPNFRGSAVSEELLERGYGEFGRKMQTDLSDGVRYLAKKGMVDPARVCIVGGSYGGYAALAGVSLDPGVYRCAVSVAGISDLRELLKLADKQARISTSWSERYMNRFLGVEDFNDPKLDQISPIKHIDAISVPVLLIHGKDDVVVPFEQSQRMLDAMRAKNKQVELIELKAEDHWLSRGPTRTQMIQATVAFLRAQNPPDSPAPDSASR